MVVVAGYAVPAAIYVLYCRRWIDDLRSPPSSGPA